jgi:apolipoprotein N-acyltransferase
MRTALKSSPPGLLGAAAVAGLGIYLSDYPVHLPALQWFALAPLLYLLLAGAQRAGWMILAGAIYGGLTGLMALHLNAGPVGAAVMILYQAVWGVMLLVVFHVLFTLSGRGPAAALLFPLLVVITDSLSQRIFMLWGTAQSFSRVQSACPFIIQVAALTGQAGVAFLVAHANLFLAGLGAFARERKKLLVHGLLFAALAGGALAYDAVSWFGASPARTIRVAAAGWAAPGPGTSSWQDKLQVLEKLIEKSDRDFRIIVYPEVAFWINRGEMPAFKAALASISKKHGLWQFAGTFDGEKQMNGIMAAGPGGEVRMLYFKTHLIKFMERYRPGSGAVGTVKVDGVLAGGLVCQDDNFQDIARANALAGARIAALPTNDWKAVKDYHAENLIYRAVENRMALVRAASGGISMIVDGRGKTLARRDPFEESRDGGPSLITAEVPLYPHRTLFTAAGRLFEWLCAAAALAAVAVLTIRRRKGPLAGN